MVARPGLAMVRVQTAQRAGRKVGAFCLS